jgi:hypothetical protein
MNTTRLFVNPDIPEVETFKNRFVGRVISFCSFVLYIMFLFGF